ncbi:MAG TPA: HIRAN domain-containing protein [Bryobacteraceae bacterium]|nr:HIRAN domain-containing protein [Bryobacteraceae bacterium]
MNRAIFLAWQDPQKRRWYPIGRLSSNGRRFVFVYTNGALDAQQTGGFVPLAAFPDLGRVYQSDSLFPLFSNRLLPLSRPDYPLFLDWLNVTRANANPLALLARSGGQRATDTLEVFPYPEELADGVYETCFFLHGLSHMPADAVQRASALAPGERLLVMWDFQNPHDPDALALRTAETYPGDIHVIGYCPRFLRGEILKLMTSGDNPPEVTVERVNPTPAPVQFRVLCRLRMRWAAGFKPFGGTEYQPIVAVEAEDEALCVA